MLPFFMIQFLSFYPNLCSQHIYTCMSRKNEALERKPVGRSDISASFFIFLPLHASFFFKRLMDKGTSFPDDTRELSHLCKDGSKAAMYYFLFPPSSIFSFFFLERFKIKTFFSFCIDSFVVGGTSSSVDIPIYIYLYISHIHFVSVSHRVIFPFSFFVE